MAGGDGFYGRFCGFVGFLWQKGRERKWRWLVIFVLSGSNGSGWW